MTISDNDTEVWIEVDNISVRIIRSHEGAICDMYDRALLQDMDAAHLAACYAYFNEAQDKLKELKQTKDVKKIELDQLDRAIDDLDLNDLDLENMPAVACPKTPGIAAAIISNWTIDD